MISKNDITENKASIFWTSLILVELALVHLIDNKLPIQKLLVLVALALTLNLAPTESPKVTRIIQIALWIMIVLYSALLISLEIAYRMQ